MIIAILLIRCSQAQQVENQWIQDLDFLEDELQTYHPGYNWYTTEDEFEQLFRAARQEVEREEIDDLGFYQLVRRLVSSVRCGHTRTGVPEQLEQQMLTEWRYMPLSIALVGDTVLVDQAISADLEKGDQILTINGVPSDQIVHRMMSYQSGDGFIETGKRQTVARFFRAYYQMFIDPMASSYELEVSRRREVVSLALSGRVWDELASLDPEPATGPWLELTHYDAYSLLRIGTFSQSAIDNGGQSYSWFLKRSFKELRDLDVQHLIVDLRGNGGGRDNYGAELVSYLVDKSFSYFDKIQVTADYQGYGDIVDTAGERLVTSHRGLSLQQAASNHFDGSLYVLVDGGSFSTCADVASVLKGNGRKLIIGEETGGGAQGNTSGNRRDIVLPHSEISVHIPLWKYTTAQAEKHAYGRGVLPDIEVRNSVDDFSQGRDAVMEQVLALIASQ